MTLEATLTTRLIGLLPPERRPAPGGTADDVVRLLGQIEAMTTRDAFRMIFNWLATTADETGLRLLGESRHLTRLRGEPLEVFRARVIGAFEFWETAGTLPGMTRALAAAGYKATIIEHVRDPDPERWAEFSVALSPLNPIKTPWKWGGGARWGEKGRRWGGLDPNAVPLEYVLDLVREAKPAHARLRRLLYSVHGWYWGGDWQWGQGRDPTDLALGWGLSHGLPALRLSGSGDNGPTWGGDEAVVLYDLYQEGSL